MSETPNEATPAEADALVASGWIVARNAGTSFATEVRAGAHAFIADEPASVGGHDGGPTPYDMLLGSLGACTAMTLRMYAGRKEWPLDAVIVALRSARSHKADCEQCVDHVTSIGPLRLERRVELRGDLTAEQRTRLLSIADRCPVKLALQRGIELA